MIIVKFKTDNGNKNDNLEVLNGYNGNKKDNILKFWTDNGNKKNNVEV